MIRIRSALFLVALMSVPAALPVEVKGYRLLSVSQTSKLLLISEIPQKTKYLLDASTAKITVDGKPAEFKDLKIFTVIKVKFDPRKGSKDGVEIDGVASEIIISTPEKQK